MTIQRDVLGYIAETASIGGFAADELSPKERWHLQSVSLAEGLQAGSYAQLRDMARAIGYECPDSAATPGWASVNILVKHPESMAALAVQSAADTVKWATARNTYIRYGGLPKGGKSRNHRDGIDEAGVSAFHGQVLDSGEYRILTDTPQLEGSLLTGCNGRPVYEVAGRESGTGSDGEPLLAHCKIVRKIG